MLTAEHVFKDYQFSTEHKIAFRPARPTIQQSRLEIPARTGRIIQAP